MIDYVEITSNVRNVDIGDGISFVKWNSILLKSLEINLKKKECCKEIISRNMPELSVKK